MLTHERLLEIMSYDPETGIARWRIRISQKNHVGDEMGYIKRDKGRSYRRVEIDGIKYYLHVLIYFYVTGEWPIEIDHHDNDGLNNRWPNLRNDSHIRNMWNKKTYSNNAFKLKGVTNDRGKFRSRITINGKQKFLGHFDCPAAASFAYQIEADKAFGEFARWQ